MGPIYKLSGSRDLTPRTRRRLAAVQSRLETFLGRRGYETVSTPVLESTELFLRKSGGELASRMYSFTDPGGHRVSLRPEFTSSVVRSYVDGTLKAQVPMRLQYCGAVFRFDSEGAGPGEFTQFGAELLGADQTAADAEVMAFAVQGLSALGVRGHRLRVGHVGVVNAMFEALHLSERARVFLMGSLDVLRTGTGGLAQVRQRAVELGLLKEQGRGDLTRLAQRLEAADAEQMVKGFLAEAVTGPTGQRTPEEVFLRYLRKLREAEDPERIQQAIELASALAEVSGPARRVMPRLRRLLGQFGLDLDLLGPVEQLFDDLGAYDLNGTPVVLDLSMARGIAYYTGPVFDIEHPKVKGATPLGGGGRYDGLVKALGGSSDLPALGFAYDLDRVAELLPAAFGEDDAVDATSVLVVAAEATMKQAVATAERLRAQGIPAELDIVSKTEADASRYAKRRGITTIMRVGRDGSTSEQEL